MHCKVAPIPHALCVALGPMNILWKHVQLPATCQHSKACPLCCRLHVCMTPAICQHSTAGPVRCLACTCPSIERNPAYHSHCSSASRVHGLSGTACAPSRALVHGTSALPSHTARPGLPQPWQQRLPGAWVVWERLLVPSLCGIRCQDKVQCDPRQHVEAAATPTRHQRQPDVHLHRVWKCVGVYVVCCRCGSA